MTTVSTISDDHDIDISPNQGKYILKIQFKVIIIYF